MAVIPIQRLHAANVVVHDLRATARNYARILGIVRWDVRHCTPARLGQTQAYGYWTEFGYSTATGSNASGVTFRLVQPMQGFSTFTEYLITRGEGIHSFCATLLDDSAMQAVVAALRQHDVTVAQASSPETGPASVMVETRQALGGFFIEITGEGSLAVDEQWDFSSEVHRPQAVEWLTQIPKIGHFGIAVSSVMDRLPHYAELLGVARWNMMHFRKASGSLEYSTFRGRPVDNAWLFAITDVADFGLELLQGTREPTDYRQTVDRSGEGIHHVLVRRGLADDEWWALRAWMESMNIGTVMSGRVRFGAAEFFYLDTREALGGYLLEVLITREAAEPIGEAAPLSRFELDLTRRMP